MNPVKIDQASLLTMSFRRFICEPSPEAFAAGDRQHGYFKWEVHIFHNGNKALNLNQIKRTRLRKLKISCLRLDRPAQ